MSDTVVYGTLPMTPNLFCGGWETGPRLQMLLKNTVKHGSLLITAGPNRSVIRHRRLFGQVKNNTLFVKAGTKRV